MFHLFDFVAHKNENEEPSGQPAPREEKLDEIQLLEQAQSRLPAFCPHSSPFATSCRSILSGFEWYAEEPLLGIDTEPLERPPTTEFPSTSSADPRSRFEQALVAADDATTTAEALMHRASAPHDENCHPSSHLSADPPPFVVDTSTISCPSAAQSPTTTSPLTDVPNDDLLATAPPQATQFPSVDSMSIDVQEDAHHPSTEPSYERTVVEVSNHGATHDDADSESDSDSDSDASSDEGSRRNHLGGSGDDDEEAEEEPQLSPRLVDARVLYETYLQRRAQTGESAEDDWPSSTSSEGEGYGYGYDYDDDDDEDAFGGIGALVGFGGWQDHRTLHRRNEDFPSHSYKPPLVGEAFQAVLPPLLSEEAQRTAASAPTAPAPAPAPASDVLPTVEESSREEAEEDDGPREEELVWSPDSIADGQVDHFLKHVQHLLDPDDYSEEKALVELHRRGYDVDDALAALVVDPTRFLKDRWTDAEKHALVAGWGLYGKSWTKIQALVPARSTGEIMQFYYQHKPRADHLRQMQGGYDCDDSESEESEEEAVDAGAPTLREADDAEGGESRASLAEPDTGSREETSSPPRRPLSPAAAHECLAPVYTRPMGEDERDREVNLTRATHDEASGQSDYGAGQEVNSRKRRREEEEEGLDEDEEEELMAAAAAAARSENECVGEGNDKSEEDEERSVKRARLDEGEGKAYRAINRWTGELDASASS